MSSMNGMRVWAVHMRMKSHFYWWCLSRVLQGFQLPTHFIFRLCHGQMITSTLFCGMWSPIFVLTSMAVYKRCQNGYIPKKTIRCDYLSMTWYTLMMTSSNRNILRVTGSLWGEYTGRRWIPPPPPPHKDQWRGAFLFSLTCPWTKGWDNNRRHCAHCHVTVMYIDWEGPKVLGYFHTRELIKLFNAYVFNSENIV